MQDDSETPDRDSGRAAADADAGGSSPEGPEFDALDEALAFAFGSKGAPQPPPDGGRPTPGGADQPTEKTPEETPSGLAGPRSAGRYVVHGLLGRGGVGTVHRGHDQDLGREVALKFLRERHVADSSVFKRFVEEAQIGGQLQHPGIVPVYELGMLGDRPFFAMKMIQGQTLAAKLSDRASPADDRRSFLNIFEDICQTMAYAHVQGVVHRDLKPANVMIGSFGEVQVVDWGMGKVRGIHHEGANQGGADQKITPSSVEPAAIETVRSTDQSSQSIMGSVMGTPAYMPPEQANGDVDAMDERSDVFSLGAVLCEILTGRPPYVGEPEELLSQAATAALGPCLACLEGSGADRDLVELATHCLSPAPEDRPHSAQIVAARIHDHLAAAEARVHEAKVEAAEARIRATALKRQRSLGAALTVAVGAGLALSLWLWREADTQRGVAEEQQQIAEQQRDQVGIIADFMSETLAGASPSVALGRDTQMLRDMLERAESRIQNGELEHSPEAERQLRITIAQTYRTIGQMDRALTMIEPAVAIARASLPPSDPRLAHTLSSYAIILLKAAEDLAAATQEAIAVSREAVAIFRSHPESVADLALGLKELSFYLESVGDAEAAVSAAAESVALYRSLPPRSEPRLAQALHRLACAQQLLGKPSEATQNFQEALEIQRRLHPDGHPDLAASLAVFGGILSENGSPDAESMLREAMAMSQRIYADSTDEKVGTQERLARHLEREGRVAEAIPLRRECLKMRRQMHAVGHPRIASALISLCITMDQAGQLQESEPLLREAVGLTENSRFVSPWDQAFLCNRLSVLHSGRGEHERAEAYARKNLRIYEALGAEENLESVRINIATALYHRARAALADGRPKNAMAIFGEARDLSEQIRSEKPEWLACRAAISMGVGRSLIAMGEPAAAKDAFLDSLATAEQNPEGEFSLLIAHYTIGGSFPEAEGALDHLREAYRIAVEHLPLEDPDYVNSREALCYLLAKRGELAELEQVRTDILAAFEKQAPNAVLETADAAIDLAIVLRQNHKLDAAASRFSQAIQLAAGSSEPTHTHGIRARLGLAKTLIRQRRFPEAERPLMDAATAAGESASPLYRSALETLVELYGMWHGADPTGGHSSKAAPWQAKLRALPSADR